jgi:hypothetical protein
MNKLQTKYNKKRASRYNLVIKITKVIISITYFFAGKDDKLPPIEQLEKFLEGMEFMIQHRGLTETIRLYKEYYRIAQKIMLSLPFNALPFHKTIRGTDVPLALKGLYPYLKSGHKWPRRIAITMCRAYTLLVTTPKPDLEPILSEGLQIPPSKLDDFRAMCVELLQPQELPTYEVTCWNFSSAKGPNGQAVLTSHLDAIALRREGLLPIWREIANAVYHPLRSSMDNILSTFKDSQYPNAVSGRLAYLPEKGGKTRVIAIGDFWSQELLKGFHKILMKILSETFKGPDSTFNQDAGFTRVRIESRGKGCYSFDLKAASDRVPMVLQNIILETLWPSVGKQIGALLSQRKFYAKDRDPVQWKVGQPLGMYSSWPLFTLTHHILIQMAGALVNKQDFRCYQLLGDDVVIWDKEVAGAYVKLMETYGVTISKEKSLISPDHSKGEFCKRLFLEGVELSPLSLNVIQNAGVSIYDIPLLYAQMRDRFGLPSFPLGHLFFESFKLGNKKNNSKWYLSILMGMMETIQGQYVEYPWCLLTDSRSTLIKGLSTYYTEKRANSIFQTNGKGKPRVRTIEELELFLKKVGIVVPSSLLQPAMGDGDDPHPIGLMINEKIGTLGWSELLNKHAPRPDATPVQYMKHMKEPVYLDITHFLYKDEDKSLPRAILSFFFEAAKWLPKDDELNSTNSSIMSY